MYFSPSHHSAIGPDRSISPTQASTLGGRGSLFSDKMLSKPAGHIPVFHVPDAQEAETVEYGEANRHFCSMLRRVSAMVDYLQAPEGERRRVGRRAEMPDRI